MTKRSLHQLGAVVCVVLMTEAVPAQITIQKADFQKIFTAHAALKLFSDTSKQVNVGKTGGPNVYDFSGLTFKDTSTQMLYLSSEVPFLATRFDPSSMFWTNSFPHVNGNPIVYFGSSTFESLGEATITDTSQEVRYHLPHEIIGQLPVTYNQSWGTAGAGLGPDTLFVNGLLRSTSSGWNSAESTYVDGYGTLIFLGQSHQCVRVRQVEVNSYTHKGFSYFTKDGIVLLVDSQKDQNDTGKVAVQNINVIAATAVTSVREADAVPEEFALEQNYPNPFNPWTIITYQLPLTTHVSLKIYDLLGREVQTLVNSEMSAGSHRVSFDASKFASGLYFYRLSAVPSERRDLVPTGGWDGQAGSFLATKKLVLLK